MRWMKWTGVIAAVVLIIAGCMPWVFISWRDFMATGIDAGEHFRKPAYGHFVFSFFFLIFIFVQTIWAKRANLLVTALNMAWAIRNFAKITACEGGECPDKQIGIYLVVVASLLMLISALFPDIKLRDKGPNV